MNIQNLEANQDVFNNVLNLLTINEIGTAARVCSRWQDQTNFCQKKIIAFNHLWIRKIDSWVNRPNLKECYFISSMLVEGKATPRLISKFIRGESDDACLLKAISVAEKLTSEQITDCMDCKRSSAVVQSILNKMNEAPESSIICCIMQNNVKMLPIFLEKTSILPKVLLEKALDFEKFECVKTILSFYPDMPVSMSNIIKMTQSQLLPKYVELMLDRYLAQGNKITFSDLSKIARQIDGRLAYCCAPHNEQTEKIFELTAKEYVKTNQIHSLELLTDDFDVEVFIRDLKHPMMGEKLIQAVEEYSIINRDKVATLFTMAKNDPYSSISSLPKEINRTIVENLL